MTEHVAEATEWGRNGDSCAAADFRPSAEAVRRMTRYNERLAEAGALIALDGLHPPVNGARVWFRGGKTQVTDGPFSESKEVLGGYWMIQARSRQEVVDWARQCPAGEATNAASLTRLRCRATIDE